MAVDIYNPFSVYNTRKKVKLNPEDESNSYDQTSNNEKRYEEIEGSSFEDRENRVWLLEKKSSYLGGSHEMEAKRVAERKNVTQALLKIKRKVLRIKI